MVQTQTIETPCGTLQGTPGKTPGVTAYKGIRYATAGRWEYPQRVTHWDGVYDASAFGACSYQPRAFYNEEDVPEKAFYYNEFRRGETYTYSEDCLFLNVWTPENAADAPVLFYIHGGGFQGGCGHEKHFSGEALCAQGLVVVTINYRLGPMGFCCLPQLCAEAGHTGNYGLYDQLCALQWVHANITAFGGNPQKITIMGQSAGGMSVQQLCVSPLTKGLVAGAVMLSGGGVTKMMGAKLAADNYPFWQSVMQRLGASSLAALRAVPPETLYAAVTAESKAQKTRMVATPVIDGVMLPKAATEIANDGEQLAVPYLLGTTSEDMMPLLLYSMAKKWVLRQTAQGKCESYLYFFSRQLPGDACGAWHSADLWYILGTLRNGWRPFTAWDDTLSDTMVRYLANFVKTGNPNGAGLAQWHAVRQGQTKAMCFGDKAIAMGKPSRLKLLYTMLTNKAVGE